MSRDILENRVDTAPIKRKERIQGVKGSKGQDKKPSNPRTLEPSNPLLWVPIAKLFHINKIIILVSIALVLRAILNYTPPITPLKVGDNAPAFSLKLKDAAVLDYDRIKGKPIVLFFYANWCPCSNLSAPLIKQAFEEFSAKGVNFIGIGFQDKESDLLKFIERYKFQFPSGVDKGQEIAKSYGVATPPTTVFINKEGKIVSIFVGKIKKYEDVSERIKKII